MPIFCWVGWAENTVTVIYIYFYTLLYLHNMAPNIWFFWCVIIIQWCSLWFLRHVLMHLLIFYVVGFVWCVIRKCRNVKLQCLVFIAYIWENEIWRRHRKIINIPTNTVQNIVCELSVSKYFDLWVYKILYENKTVLQWK